MCNNELKRLLDLESSSNNWDELLALVRKDKGMEARAKEEDEYTHFHRIEGGDFRVEGEQPGFDPEDIERFNRDADLCKLIWEKRLKDEREKVMFKKLVTKRMKLRKHNFLNKVGLDVIPFKKLKIWWNFFNESHKVALNNQEVSKVLEGEYLKVRKLWKFYRAARLMKPKGVYLNAIKKSLVLFLGLRFIEQSGYVDIYRPIFFKTQKKDEFEKDMVVEKEVVGEYKKRYRGYKGKKVSTDLLWKARAADIFSWQKLLNQNSRDFLLRELETPIGKVHYLADRVKLRKLLFFNVGTEKIGLRKKKTSIVEFSFNKWSSRITKSRYLGYFRDMHSLNSRIYQNLGRRYKSQEVIMFLKLFLNKSMRRGSKMYGIAFLNRLLQRFSELKKGLLSNKNIVKLLNFISYLWINTFSFRKVLFFIKKNLVRCREFSLFLNKRFLGSYENVVYFYRSFFPIERLVFKLKWNVVSLKGLVLSRMCSEFLYCFSGSFLEIILGVYLELRRVREYCCYFVRKFSLLVEQGVYLLKLKSILSFLKRYCFILIKIDKFIKGLERLIGYCLFKSLGLFFKKYFYFLVGKSRIGEYGGILKFSFLKLQSNFCGNMLNKCMVDSGDKYFIFFRLNSFFELKGYSPFQDTCFSILGTAKFNLKGCKAFSIDYYGLWREKFFSFYNNVVYFRHILDCVLKSRKRVKRRFLRFFSRRKRSKFKDVQVIKVGGVLKRHIIYSKFKELFVYILIILNRSSRLMESFFDDYMDVLCFLFMIIFLKIESIMYFELLSKGRILGLRKAFVFTILVELVRLFKKGPNGTFYIKDGYENYLGNQLFKLNKTRFVAFKLAKERYRIELFPCFIYSYRSLKIIEFFNILANTWNFSKFSVFTYIAWYIRRFSLNINRALFNHSLVGSVSILLNAFKNLVPRGGLRKFVRGSRVSYRRWRLSFRWGLLVGYKWFLGPKVNKKIYPFDAVNALFLSLIFKGPFIQIKKNHYNDFLKGISSRRLQASRLWVKKGG